MKKMTKKEMNKKMLKMLSTVSDFQKAREISHIELMNDWYFENATKRFKKYKKKIKKSKRVLGMGTKPKQVVSVKQSRSLEISTRRYLKYRGLKQNQ